MGTLVRGFVPGVLVRNIVEEFDRFEHLLPVCLGVDRGDAHVRVSEEILND